MKWEEKEKILNNLLLPNDESLLNEYSKHYGTMSGFKVNYYQGIVDIRGNLLKVGDSVYYVFGKGLEIGVIDEILPYKIGYTVARIKIKGKKKYFNSYAIVKI
jgi:hypothetical protein